MSRFKAFRQRPRLREFSAANSGLHRPESVANSIIREV